MKDGQLSVVGFMSIFIDPHSLEKTYGISQIDTIDREDVGNGNSRDRHIRSGQQVSYLADRLIHPPNVRQRWKCTSEQGRVLVLGQHLPRQARANDQGHEAVVDRDPRLRIGPVRGKPDRLRVFILKAALDDAENGTATM